MGIEFSTRAWSIKDSNNPPTLLVRVLQLYISKCKLPLYSSSHDNIFLRSVSEGSTEFRSTSGTHLEFSDIAKLINCNPEYSSPFSFSAQFSLLVITPRF
jgi:hypothetical protein